MRNHFLASIIVLLSEVVADAQMPKFGFQPAPPGKYGSVPKAISPLIGITLPPSKDLSAEMPPPGEQGQQNSCVGWAVAYALKSYQERVERGWTISDAKGIVESRVFSPSFIYNQINDGVDLGSNFGRAFNILATRGAAPLSAMPYSPPYAPIPMGANDAAAEFKIDTFRSVDTQSIPEVKAQLAAGFPVIIAGRMYKQFVDLGEEEVWSTASGPVVGRHALAVVGYDDSKKAFKVINSWGQKWGSGGYGWISYDLFPVVIDEGYIAVDLKGVNNTPATIPPDEWTPPVVAPQNSTITIDNANLNFVDYTGAVGLLLTGRFTIPSGVQGTAQIVIALTFQNGVIVSTADPAFRLPSGQAAFGTPPLKLDGSGIVSLPWYAFVRYCSLHVPKSKLCIPMPSPPWIGPVKSDLRATPALFIDQFGVAKGVDFNFYVAL